MTNETETRDEWPDNPQAVVEAFLDGERVGSEALRSALADAAARDHFVDVLALREAVGTMEPLAFSAHRPAGGSRTRVRWLATAAALVLSLTAGYVAGQQVVASAPDAPGVEAAIHFDDAPLAPAPTRIISLRPGVNWTERSGGR